MWAVPVLALLVFGAFGQHVYTDDEIAEGGRLYQANCGRCHGAQGNTVVGIDLGRALYRRPLSETELIRVIRTGVPNTTMAPTNVTEAQAGTIIAFMRTIMQTMAASNNTTRPSNSLPAGDAARGKTIFESSKSDCLRCHRVNENGSRVGPDLSDVGTRRRQPEIELALFLPNAEVQPVNRTVRLVTRSGETITGRLLNHDTLTLLLIDAKEQLRSFQKQNLREWGVVESPMPSYRDKLTPQELADVISYLVSLKGQVTP